MNNQRAQCGGFVFIFFHMCLFRGITVTLFSLFNNECPALNYNFAWFCDCGYENVAIFKFVFIYVFIFVLCDGKSGARLPPPLFFLFFVLLLHELRRAAHCITFKLRLIVCWWPGTYSSESISSAAWISLVIYAFSYCFLLFPISLSGNHAV